MRKALVGIRKIFRFILIFINSLGWPGNFWDCNVSIGMDTKWVLEKREVCKICGKVKDADEFYYLMVKKGQKAIGH